jgi:pimeloyl-ACP methyl ester carboxylesterase
VTTIARSLCLPVAEGVELRVLVRDPPENGSSPAAQVPFLLVHGLASNARLWDGCADRLAALGHRVAAVDLRGHGWSSKPDAGYDFATIVEDLVAVIGALGLDRPVVAGQSWGGNVVIELAALRPEVTRGVVAVDGGTIELQDRFGSWDETRDVLRPPDLAGLRRAQLEGMLRSTHPDWPEEGIEGALANFEEQEDGTIRPWLTFDRHLTILHELWRHRPSVRFREIRVPVLLVPAASGPASWTHDKEASVARAEAALVGAPHRTVWFRPADHDLHAQHPERLARVLHDATQDGFFA